MEKVILLIIAMVLSGIGVFCLLASVMMMLYCCGIEVKL